LPTQSRRRKSWKGPGDGEHEKGQPREDQNAGVGSEKARRQGPVPDDGRQKHEGSQGQEHGLSPGEEREPEAGAEPDQVSRRRVEGGVRLDVGRDARQVGQEDHGQRAAIKARFDPFHGQVQRQRADEPERAHRPGPEAAHIPLGGCRQQEARNELEREADREAGAQQGLPAGEHFGAQRHQQHPARMVAVRQVDAVEGRDARGREVPRRQQVIEGIVADHAEEPEDGAADDERAEQQERERGQPEDDASGKAFSLRLT